MEQNYVTVTLCVPIVQRFARSVGVKLLVSCYTVAAAPTQVPPTSPPPPSSGIPIVRLDIKGRIRNVSQTSILYRLGLRPTGGGGG